MEILDIDFQNNPSCNEDGIINELNYFIQEKALDIALCFGKRIVGTVNLDTEDYNPDED